jgi:hypothetical protein
MPGYLILDDQQTEFMFFGSKAGKTRGKMPSFTISLDG